MQSDNPLFRQQVRIGLDEWTAGEGDWPQVDERLAEADAAGIDRDKARALLVAIWACENLIADRSRNLRRRAALQRARWTAGPDRSRELAWARSNARKEFDRIKSHVIYGFFLDQERGTVSERQIRALMSALELVMHINAD